MKPFAFITILLLGITSCASLFLYKTTEKKYESIEGSSVKNSMPFYYYGFELTGNITISLYRLNGKTSYHGIELDYTGGDWAFIKDMQIKIDNGNVITLVDSNPSRYVNSQAVVNENFNFMLNEDVVKSLQSCSSLDIQIKNTLIKITPEGVIKIKEFLDNYPL